MSKTIQAIRGMNDCLPSDTPVWQKVESHIRDVMKSYGYHEIRMPIVEMTGLFKRAIGEVTDVVEKEMYTFEDRNGDSLTLRPEGTANCVRAGIEHGLLYNQEQRLWYLGPMFRHERPQKGRYRQFHQLGIEVYGLAGPDIDAEIILMSARLWRALGLSDQLTLELNSIGSLQARQAYKASLVSYLSAHEQSLDQDSQRRLHTNPLRILDSKNEQVQQILVEAPQLTDYLDEASQSHFNELCALLDHLGIQYRLNPRLVRGLDYYNQTVFEWTTTALGAQGTVCGGGRYDGLVEQMGGKATPAVGFAIGIERLILLYEIFHGASQPTAVDLYLISTGQAATMAAMKIAEQLRTDRPELTIMQHHGGGNLKKQFKRADKANAQIAIVLAENEIAAGKLVIKDLRNGEQYEIAQDEVLNQLSNLL